MVVPERNAPRTRRQQAAATRAHILRVALQLFGAQGYAATTTKQIAAAAGVSEGSIFHHFPTKLDLLRSVPEYRTTLPEQVTTLLNDPGDRSITDVLTAIAERFTDMDTEEQSYVRLIFAESGSDDELYTLLRELLEHTAAAIAGYLDRQAAAGVVRTDLATMSAAKTLQAAHIIFLLTNRHLSKPELRRRAAQYAREVVDVWLYGALNLDRPGASH